MALTATERQRRSRAHRAGDHTFCDFLRCPDAPPGAVTPSVTATDGAPDRRSALEALRDRLTELFHGADDPRDAAALSRELRAVLADLAALKSGDRPKESRRDELAKRREERRKAQGL